jgi:hypothetical protein
MKSRIEISTVSARALVWLGCSAALYGATAACAPSNISIGNAPDFHPPKEHPSNLHMEIHGTGGTTMTQGSGETYAQYDPATSTLSIYLIEDEAAPLGPNCDFSGLRQIKTGGFSVLRIPGMSSGKIAKVPVAEGTIYNAAVGSVAAMDATGPLDSVAINILKYDSTSFEGSISSADNSSTMTYGKIVAHACPDLGGGDGGVTATGGADVSSSVTATASDTADAGAVTGKKKKKKSSK